MYKKILSIVSVTICILGVIFVAGYVFFIKIIKDKKHEESTVVSQTASFDQENNQEVQSETSQISGTDQEEELVVNTSTSEALLTEYKRVTQAGVSVVIQKKGNLNYLIVEKDGEQYQLDMGEMNLSGNFDEVSKLQIFSDIQLTSDGHYAMIGSIGWESSAQTVWNLLEKKKVVRFFVPANADFTPDGKSAFACASSEFGGDYYGVVVDLATGKNVYTMPVEESKLVPLPYVTCSMKTNTIVEFTVKNQDTGEILKTFEYSLL